MSALAPVATALFPLFALIAAGALMWRAGFPERAFWPQLERLIYFVLFPALLLESLGTADIDPGRIPAVAAALLGTLAVMSVVALLLRPLLRVDGPGFSSVYQGTVRFNTYLAIAIAAAVYGSSGTAVAALVLALLIPMLNVLCVMVLMVFAGGRVGAWSLLRGIARNPLILACLAGLGLNAGGIGLNSHLAGLLAIAGDAALPLGLLTVGAGLRLDRVWHDGRAIAAATLLKLALMPAVAWVAARLIGMDTLETQILVLVAALPTAPSAYILARQLGGDHRMLATLLTVQTAASALSLPLVLSAVGMG